MDDDGADTLLLFWLEIEDFDEKDVISKRKLFWIFQVQEADICEFI